MGIKKPDRTRWQVTLTEYFILGITKLVEDGIYLDKGAVIREALRLIFERHSIEAQPT